MVGHSAWVVQAAPGCRFSHTRLLVLQTGSVAGHSALLQHAERGMHPLPHVLWVAVLQA